MSYVNVSEVGTFRDTLGLYGSGRRIDVFSLTSTTMREVTECRCMIPTEALGRRTQFIPQDTSVLNAHDKDFSSALACFRFEKKLM